MPRRVDFANAQVAEVVTERTVRDYASGVTARGLTFLREIAGEAAGL